MREQTGVHEAVADEGGRGENNQSSRERTRVSGTMPIIHSEVVTHLCVQSHDEIGSVANKVSASPQGYIRYSVTEDGDCGYTAFGITRKEALALLQKKVESIRDMIKIPVEEALLTADFYNYLLHRKVIKVNHQQLINDAVLRRNLATDLAIQAAYIHYDIRDKEIDDGWAHPKILQALAHIRDIELRMWTLGTNDVLTPHRVGDEDYSVYRSDTPNQRVDLLFVNGNHFERLEYQGYGEDIPEKGIYPLNRTHSDVSGQAAVETSSNANVKENDSDAAEKKIKKLYAEQSIVSRIGSPILHNFREHLRGIKGSFVVGKTAPTCFISYAWPLEHENRAGQVKFRYEENLQGFLKTLHLHLELAGIIPFLDIIDCEVGKNIYNFMTKVDSSHFVILILTESLKLKHEDKCPRAVRDELDRITRRLIKDQDFFLPILFGGDIDKSTPAGLKGYSCNMDWTNIRQNYFNKLQKLIGEIYKKKSLLSEDNQSKYNNLWGRFIENNLIPNFDPEQELEHHYHESYMQDFIISKQYKSLMPIRNDLIQEELKNILREKYTTNPKIINHSYDSYFDKNSYIDLVIVKHEDAIVIDQNEVQRNKITTEKSISYSDIFYKNQEPSNNIPERKILLLGHPGSGKSFLCYHLSRMWAKGELWHNQFQWVFYFKLRDIASANDAPELNKTSEMGNIIYYTFFKNSRYTIGEIQHFWKKFLLDGKENILFLIDGYDEVSGQKNAASNELIKIFKEKNNNSHIYVLMTSRHYAHFPEDTSCILHNIGFTKEGIELYVERFFSSEDDEDDRNKIKMWLKNNLKFEKNFYMPLNIAFLCDLWCQELSKKQVITIANLYHLMIIKLILNNLKKDNTTQYDSNISNKALLKNKKKFIYFLQIIAYNMLKDGKQIISGDLLNEEFKKYTENIEIENCTAELDRWKGFGFFDAVSEEIKKENKQKGKKNYYFNKHLSFYEFLAARHFAMGIINGNLSRDDKQFFLNNKYNPAWKMTWIFVAGIIIEPDNQSENRAKHLDIFFSLLFDKPRDLYGLYEFDLFVRCGEEAEWFECHATKALLEYLGKWTIKIAYLYEESDHQLYVSNLQELFSACPQAMVKMTYQGRNHIFDILMYELKNISISVIALLTLAFLLAIFSSHLSVKFFLELIKEFYNIPKENNSSTILYFSLEFSISASFLLMLLSIISRIIDICWVRRHERAKKLLRVFLCDSLQFLKDLEDRFRKHDITTLIRFVKALEISRFPHDLKDIKNIFLSLFDLTLYIASFQQGLFFNDNSYEELLNTVYPKTIVEESKKIISFIRTERKKLFLNNYFFQNINQNSINLNIMLKKNKNSLNDYFCSQLLKIIVHNNVDNSEAEGLLSREHIALRKFIFWQKHHATSCGRKEEYTKAVELYCRTYRYDVEADAAVDHLFVDSFGNPDRKISDNSLSSFCCRNFLNIIQNFSVTERPVIRDRENYTAVCCFIIESVLSKISTMLGMQNRREPLPDPIITIFRRRQFFRNEKDKEAIITALDLFNFEEVQTLLHEIPNKQNKENFFNRLESLHIFSDNELSSFKVQVNMILESSSDLINMKQQLLDCQEELLEVFLKAVIDCLYWHSMRDEFFLMVTSKIVNLYCIPVLLTIITIFYILALQLSTPIYIWLVFLLFCALTRYFLPFELMVFSHSAGEKPLHIRKLKAHLSQPIYFELMIKHYPGYIGSCLFNVTEEGSILPIWLYNQMINFVPDCFPKVITDLQNILHLHLAKKDTALWQKNINEFVWYKNSESITFFCDSPKNLKKDISSVRLLPPLNVPYLSRK